MAATTARSLIISDDDDSNVVVISVSAGGNVWRAYLSSSLLTICPHHRCCRVVLPRGKGGSQSSLDCDLTELSLNSEFEMHKCELQRVL